MRQVEDIIKQLEIVEQLYCYDEYKTAYRDGYVKELKWVLTVHQVKPVYENNDPVLGEAVKS